MTLSAIDALPEAEAAEQGEGSPEGAAAATPKMTREEMLAILDAPAEEAPPLVEIEGGIAGEKPEASKPASETALLQDEWSMRKGREVLDESDRLKELFEVKKKPDGAGTERKEFNKRREQAELNVADFHTAAFEPEPILAEKSKNERIREYMKNLMETPEFKALHSETQLDEVASEIATAQFATGWIELSKKERPKNDFDADMQAMAAAGAALKGAKEEIGEMRDACAALGGDGGGKGKMNNKKVVDMFRRVKKSESLKRICELAGRYRRFAQAQQRKKVLHGRDDVVGVVLDGEISRLLPQELVQLDDPELELDAMRKIIERQALCREFRGIEPQARGPIVVVVDESGSMSGENIYTAKAMALALAWVARSQNRWYALVGFSGGTGGCFCVCPPNGVPMYRDFEESSQKDWAQNHDGLMDWLEHFYGGGTNLDVPLDMLPKQWEKMGTPKGKTDIICLTDAIVDVPANLRDSFLKFKEEEKVKMITLIIGGHGVGQMPQVSDRVHCVRSLSLEEEAVAEALGV